MQKSLRLIYLTKSLQANLCGLNRYIFTRSRLPQPPICSFADTYSVIPTYLQNGRIQPLYTGPAFPITFQGQRIPAGYLTDESTSQPINDDIFVVELKAVNSVTMEISFDDYSGRVLSIAMVPVEHRSEVTGTQNQLVTENIVRNIIGNAEELDFGTDGKIQFITHNKSTRITFQASSV